MELKKTFLVSIIYGIVVGALSLALPLYLDQQGYSIASIGWIFGAAALISGILGIGLGAMSDRFGRKPLIIFYNLLTGVGAFIMGWVSGLPGFIAGKSLTDFSTGGLWNALLSRVSDISINRERALQFGKYIGFFGISYAVAHWLAGEIIGGLGFQQLFLAVICVSIIGAILTLLFNERGKRREKHHFSLEILKTHDGKVNALVSFLHGVGASIAYTYVIYLFLAKQYLFSPVQIGLFMALTCGAWGISSYFTGRFVDRFGMKKSFLYGSLLNGAVWAGIVLFSTDFWPFAFFILMDNITYPIFNLASIKASSLIPREENLGRDISVFGYAHTIGALIAIATAGMIAEISYDYVFALRGIIFVIAGLVFWKWIRLKE